MKSKFKILVIFFFVFIKMSSQCDNYGSIVISEIYFDTRYNENINSKYHHFGEYIEIFNSSNEDIDLNGWKIKDNHTEFKFTLNGGYNSDLIIRAGGYKIITPNGFYAYGLSQGGAQSAIGARNKFIELFPEVVSDPNFNENDIILQNTMILYNDVDKVSLYNSNGKLIDEVSYLNEATSKLNPLGYLGLSNYTVVLNPRLDNFDGGLFNGPIGLVPTYDVNGFPILDTNGDPVLIQNNDFKKAIYRSNISNYYSDGGSTFQVAVANPFSLPFVIPLKPIDPRINDFPPGNSNETESISYDIKTGTIDGKVKTYFDDFGKARVTLSKDFKTNFVWGTEFVYDSFNRKKIESFPTTTCFDFEKINFYSNSSAKATLLDKFYSNSNGFEPYQATAAFPYSEVNYDKLNPGNVVNVVGGNQIGGQWKTGYSYTVPAAQEMYYIFGYNFFNGTIASGKEEIITKFYKTVSVDANGVENVSFSDAEGKTLATARAGTTVPSSINPYLVHSLIGTQGFVDVHIPIGISSSQITLIGGVSLYKVYDLKTGLEITPLTTSSLIGGNAYRVVAQTIPTTNPKVYVTNATPGVLSYDTGAKGVSYYVNYYDFAINIYDRTGRLTKNIQPNGFRSVYSASPSTITIIASPSYLSSANYSTNYLYNTLGQVTQVINSDEGTSKFAYRKDGQIRYSQSALQTTLNKVSYTNYDSYGRPYESGVITGTSTIWSSSLAGVDNLSLVTGTPSERVFTIYDYIDNSFASVPIPPSLSLSVLSPTYIQKNTAGNVVATYKADLGSNINSITWYSYDVYGRTEWVVQYNEGIGGVKTIDYEYDYRGNVSKVIYQKNVVTEKFVHQYTYDINGVVTKVETASGTNPLVTDAEYSYYVTGELKRVNIGQGAQGLDYVYTLGGMVKSINHPSLETNKDPGKDGEPLSINANVAKDLFGLTLDYYQGDYVRTGTNILTSSSVAPDYVGNIKAVRWANKNTSMDFVSPSTVNQKAYTYNYNRNNWITDATFGDTNNTANITPYSNNKLKENAIQYDSNGNITKLQRTKEDGIIVDNLTYNYSNLTPKNNQLRNVTDAVTATTYTNDIDPQAANNYVYDAIGQMTRNVQENLYYYYNNQGLVTEVRRGTINPVVKFYYNERGQRIRKETFITNTTTLQTTDYYVYDLAGNILSVYNKLGTNGIVSQKEIAIYGISRLGVCMKTSPEVRNYEITDHLGNVRAVVQKTTGFTTYPMTSYADYYPFGEKLPSRNSTINYRFAFQGQELDSETGMEAFQLRLWDGRLGRWLTTDPYNAFYSPYLGLNNNPISSIDPDGGIPINVITGIIGAVVNAGVNVYQQYQNGQLDWKSGKTWSRIGVAAGGGFVAGFSGNLSVAVATNVVGDVADQVITNDGFNNINYTNSIKSGVFAFGAGKLSGALIPKLSPTISSIYERCLTKGTSVIGKPYLSSGISNFRIYNFGINFAKGTNEAFGSILSGIPNTHFLNFKQDYVGNFIRDTYKMNKMFLNAISYSFKKGKYKITVGELIEIPTPNQE